jgi:hypothetical protein
MSRLASVAALLLAATASAQDLGSDRPAEAPAPEVLDAGDTGRSAADAGADPALVEPSPEPGPAGLAATFSGFRVVASGYVQVDAVPYSQASLDELDPSTGQPLNDVAVTIRHAHLKLSAFRWLFSAAAEADVNTVSGVAVRLYAAEVCARWPLDGPVPLVQLRAGLLRIPFGVDVQQDPLLRPFLEQTTFAQALFPGSFDLGVELSGGWRFVRYRLAVMNGEPVGERALPAKDPNAAKDFVGRLSAVGSPVGPLLLEAGVSGLWGTGFHPGQPATKDTLVWIDANEDGLVQATELQVLAGQPATPSANFNRFALGADLKVAVQVPVLGRLEAQGELAWAKDLDRGLYVADPVASGRDARELGWSVAVTQQLPLGFVVGLRRDVYNPDADASDQQGAKRVPLDASVSTWSAMVAWRWERTARVIAQYDHQTNALGRGLDGAPTTLGADKLTLRAEVAF